MRILKLSETVAVSAQIAEADVADIAAAGFKVLINNRPDGEEGGQPENAKIEAAAQAAGLEYHYLPVNAINFPGPGFDQMTDLLGNSDRPVLAFCRTGTRCANLWVASCVEEDREEARAVALSQGFDLGMSAPWS
jgi:uncharacterized protein (TIGR01244 family)